MVDRYRVWLGAGVLAGGVSAAMLAGAGVATADEGSSSGSGAPASSGSDDSAGSKRGPKAPSGADKPGKKAATSKDDDGNDDGDDDASTPAADNASDNDDATDTTGSPDGETDSDEQNVPDEDAEEEPDVPGVDPGVESVADDDSPGGKHRAPEPESVAPVVTVAENDVDVPVTEPAVAPTAPSAPVDGGTAADTATAPEAPSTLVASIDTDLGSDGAVVMRAAAADVPSWNETAADLLAVLNDIGTQIYTLYTSAMQFLAGPVRAPFGSRVRVESSTLTLGTGVVVPADWYFPQQSKPPTGLIYLQHGFLATASFYSATAAYLAETTNSIVVAPTLTWNVFDIANYPLTLPSTHRAVAELFTGDRAVLNASAKAAGYRGKLPTRVVLAGHSAGGGLVAGAAGYMAELGIADNLAGVVMLDGAAFLDYMDVALAKIPLSIPVYNLAAQPDTWNLYGNTTTQLAHARPGMFTGVSVDGGLHTDAMQSTSMAIQLAATLAVGVSSPWSLATTGILASGWINDMFKGTHTANLYGSKGSLVDILIGWFSTPARVQRVGLSATNEDACVVSPAARNCSHVPSLDGVGASRPAVAARPQTSVA